MDPAFAIELKMECGYWMALREIIFTYFLIVFVKISFTHVNREANSIADAPAKEGALIMHISLLLQLLAF
ncbi:hypothetical protein A2U01_0008635 [Trifolium medium]|uniref:Uncharacterized protein n=1 Tax=Trifolium medium TaxID=97028 RepID=A0A392MJU5_9FABA|nr:hypothetical protein [Trifolium medium]